MILSQRALSIQSAERESPYIREPRPDTDKQRRLGFVLGIYHLAGKEFPDDPKGWLLRPNSHPDLGGRPPLLECLMADTEILPWSFVSRGLLSPNYFVSSGLSQIESYWL